MHAFITIEGPDGSGKTSQSKYLAEFLDAEWRCFPDRRTPIGKLIDGHLKAEWWATAGNARTGAARDKPIDALAFQALQLANRIEVQPDILLTLESRPVVCDRYWGSGYAYGSADGLDPRYMLEIHRGLLRPTLSVLLDVPIEVAVERLKARGAPAERYESNLDHMRTVSDRYRELWELAPEHGSECWVRIDASAPYEVVRNRLRNVVLEVLGTRNADAW